jgi:hypothetical protein
MLQFNDCCRTLIILPATIQRGLHEKVEIDSQRYLLKDVFWVEEVFLRLKIWMAP